MFLLYNLLLTLTFPIWGAWMWWRTRQRKEAPNWTERTGNYNLPKRGDRRRVWIHAVSVGEVVAALSILREVRKALPKHEIVLSVTTSSGHQTARERAEGLYDHLVYFPVDVARFQLAAMQRVRPDVVAIMETELWMNFLWAAKTFGAETLLINGRISDRSYPRSMKLRAFYRALLSEVDRCLMQTTTDAQRIRDLGAKHAEVLGNCKFDQALEGRDADAAEWRAELGLEASRPVVVVGSIRHEEFDLLAAAIFAVREDVQWVIAPRHVERATALVESIRGAANRPFPMSSRVADGRLGGEGILILDSYGELAKVYAVADVVVIGGGFANLGGQNLLQPLAHGHPIVHGPHMQNFRDVAAMAEAAGATRVAATAAELAAAVNALLSDRQAREQMGAAGKSLVSANVGASARYAKAIAEAVKRTKAK